MKAIWSARAYQAGAVTYKEIADQAAERIYLACQQSKAGSGQVKAILDPYKPKGSTRFVNFATKSRPRQRPALPCQRGRARQ